MTKNETLQSSRKFIKVFLPVLFFLCGSLPAFAATTMDCFGYNSGDLDCNYTTDLNQPEYSFRMYDTEGTAVSGYQDNVLTHETDTAIFSGLCTSYPSYTLTTGTQADIYYNQTGIGTPGPVDSPRNYAQLNGIGDSLTGGCSSSGTPSGPPGPSVILDTAVESSQDGVAPTIHAKAHTNFYPEILFITAIRIDGLSPHHEWIESPVSASNTIDTADFQGQLFPNGTWRVRAFAQVSSDLPILSSPTYTDVIITSGNWSILTVNNLPIGDYSSASDTNTIIQPGTTGSEGYTFSASAAAIVAAGGLSIDRNGCASISLTEDATSTLCASGTWLDSLEAYPLISWPAGIAGAAWNAWQNTTPDAYHLTLPASGDGWTPAIDIINSSSSTEGVVSAYGMNPTKYRPLMELFVYAMWVMALRKKASELLH